FCTPLARTSSTRVVGPPPVPEASAIPTADAAAGVKTMPDWGGGGWVGVLPPPPPPQPPKARTRRPAASPESLFGFVLFVLAVLGVLAIPAHPAPAPLTAAPRPARRVS